jgi:hypothetical protein
MWRAILQRGYRGSEKGLFAHDNNTLMLISGKRPHEGVFMLYISVFFAVLYPELCVFPERLLDFNQCIGV